MGWRSADDHLDRQWFALELIRDFTLLSLLAAVMQCSHIMRMIFVLKSANSLDVDRFNWCEGPDFLARVAASFSFPYCGVQHSISLLLLGLVSTYKTHVGVSEQRQWGLACSWQIYALLCKNLYVQLKHLVQDTSISCCSLFEQHVFVPHPYF